MTETLLSPSNVLIFGRVMADIDIKIPRVTPKPNTMVTVIATADTALDPYPGMNNIVAKARQRVLLSKQADPEEIGIYVVKAHQAPNVGTHYLEPLDLDLKDGLIIKVRRGTAARRGLWQLRIDPDGEHEFTKVKLPAELRSHNPFSGDRLGANELLKEQLTAENEDESRIACFARIYGFSFEGCYYDLPRPMLFLVHGEGYPATEARTGLKGVRKPSRAPGDPSLTGLASAEFEFADDIMVWSYDKADYTIRMDVETGMFEQVLLEAYFSEDQSVSGMRVSGMRVSGMRVAGMRVAGMRVSGMRVAGARGRGDAGD